MGEGHIDIDKHVRNYIMVFVALMVLTVVTVAVYYIDLSTAGAVTLAPIGEGSGADLDGQELDPDEDHDRREVEPDLVGKVVVDGGNVTVGAAVPDDSHDVARTGCGKCRVDLSERV